MRCSRAGCSGSGSISRVTGGDGGTSRSGGGAGAGAGSGTGAGAGADASSQEGTCSTVRSSGSSAGGATCCSGSAVCFWAASVARNSSASGPSRTLARRRAIEHLLGELAIHVRGLPGRVVLEHGLPLHRGLCVAHRLADPRVQDEVAEVLLEDVHRLPRV